MDANIVVKRVEYSDIAPMRELFRHEAHCQIVRDSTLRRGFADAYLFLVDGLRAGYGGVWNRNSPNRIMEFYILPHIRARNTTLSGQIGRAFIEASGATSIEAQTNLPALLELLLEATSGAGDVGNTPPTREDGFTSALQAENFLFADSHATYLPPPALSSARPCVFRRMEQGEAERVFTHQVEPVGEWVIEGDAGDGQGRRVLATGGFLTHYNPPYGDIFYEVDAAARRKGVAAYLAQEIKRVCYEAGHCPGARCEVGNVGSRRTLLKAGFAICGQIVSGAIRHIEATNQDSHG